MKIKLKSPNFYAYFRSKKKENLLTGSLLCISGIIATLPGIIRLFSTIPSYSFTITNFDHFIADTGYALLQILPSFLVFAIAYMLWESHSLGWKLSIATTIISVLLGVTNFVPLEFAGIIATLSFSAAVIEISVKKRTPQKTHDSPIITENLAKFALKISGAICLTILFGMIVYIAVRASPYITFDFLTGTEWNWANAGRVLNGVSTGSMGGVIPFAVGSLLLVSFCELIAIPLGLGAAIYLSEYATQNKLTNTVRFFVETLAGIPSVVIALMGYEVFVWAFGWGPSLLGGALGLAFMILPFNIRIAEEALRSVPAAYREASFALGATKWQTIRRSVLFPASPGIITGFLLGVGAALGETIVIAMLAGEVQAQTDLSFLSQTFFSQTPLIHVPIPSLTVFAWKVPSVLTLGNSSSTNIVFEMYGVSLAGAFVLIIMYLTICAVGLVIRNYLTKKITGK